ncbi:MAG: class I SAM-dependent methyltransferase [Candidatus Beckwithbacteria bacterium]|nr:class I SAM-dependent methyltransferase [Candidatus Beckwithbacteria bacterium]
MALKIKYFHRGQFDPSQLREDNIDRLSTSLVPHGSKVLELGCATGFMGNYLTKKLHCRVIGVDINPAVKADITGDLAKTSVWQEIKPHRPFDVVFASAILEHLPDPETTLQLIKSVLKPKGILIITLPNVAHWRQRLKLLRGHWDYEDYGLLDQTHLRFFNYFSGQRLITAAGFTINQILIDPAGGLKYFNWLVKHFPNLYAYQICIKANK